MIPFTKPTLIDKEIASLGLAMSSEDPGSSITDVCDFLRQKTGVQATYFCNSCSDALEITSLAMELSAADEIIVPDYTFVTSASSFALRGAKVIFCDVDKHDLCLDLEMAERLITKKTKAIVWVDYAGCANRAKEARKLCDKYGLLLLQDAAQSIGNWLFFPYNDCFQGDFITYSFHSTKNVHSGGEGGALLVRNDDFVEIVDMIFEKGTNRRSFIRKEIDKYTWRTLGSSFAGSYSQAALLRPQLENLKLITSARKSIWNKYFEYLNNSGFVQSGWKIPLADNVANGHMFWMLAPSKDLKDKLLDFCGSEKIQLVSHYQSLAKSPAGIVHGLSPMGVETSEMATECLVRLPLWHGLTEDKSNDVLDALRRFLDLHY
jgi:dTDP-4-amino-4,6-dideoxygalactose transaminase